MSHSPAQPERQAPSIVEVIAHYLEFGTPVEFEAIAAGVVTVLAEAGYVIVPREPTEAMAAMGSLEVWTEHLSVQTGSSIASKVWRAMVEAAE